MPAQAQMPIKSDHEADSTRMMLDAIESEARVTQRGLSAELGIALGLTNIYLKRCISKGLVKTRKAPARRYAYYLTAKGFSEKARLTAKFLTRSLGFFRLAREDCSDLFQHSKSQGCQCITFVGAGDLCEIAILAALDCGLEVSAVLDESTNRQRLAGTPVVRSLTKLSPGEILVITDMKDPQGAYERMIGQFGVEKVFFPSLLRLSRRKQPVNADKLP
ncbi:winged helix-turn-helix transcriptional regulator [Pelagibius litoralis]|uniref:Winged helix-turn-helix transcriptional regulator n=1 Tax=Pelagibius litoralis TaxID=374515 RepID=A0A967EVT5_9PROT|nr:winged helix-turn-helix transcriptional regulator [Pelagibius litoralis]NIA69032.1 winged helix-turn-helix transcriptional regulator [Pelagibius litoralis]